MAAAAAVGIIKRPINSGKGEKEEPVAKCWTYHKRWCTGRSKLSPSTLSWTEECYSFRHGGSNLDRRLFSLLWCSTRCFDASISYTQWVRVVKALLRLWICCRWWWRLFRLIFCPFTSRDPSEEGFTALPPDLNLFVSLEFNLAFRLFGAVQ